MARRTSKSFDIRLIGGRKMQRRFDAIDQKTRGKVLRKALRAGGKLIHAQAKINTPVLTGARRRATKLRALKRSRKRVGVQIIVDRNALGIPGGKYFYPAAGEYGTDDQDADQAMRKALESKRAAANEKVRDTLWAGIRDAARSSK